jgi:hypothetical protein
MSHSTGWQRVAAAGAALVAAGGWAGCTVGLPGEADPACVLDGADAESERWPGYPYPFDDFKQDIAPILVADCAAGGCHGPAAPPAGGSGGFTVYERAASGGCDLVRTFKQFRAVADLTDPPRSRILHALRGGGLTGDVPHPLDYTEAEGGEARLDAIAAFIAEASATCVADGGCAADVRDFFAHEVFQRDIQPGLDQAGCAASAACHAQPDGQAGFALPVEPAPDSPEMDAARRMAASRVSLDAEPRATVFYAKAANRHGGGASTPVDDATAEAIEGWIAAAIDARGQRDDLGCANPAVLDLDVFRDDILPILRGDVDLNGGDGTATGCTRGPCHGQAHPGGLTLVATDPPEAQLASFACFVSLTSPASSQVLLCPRGDRRCQVSPHPGDRIFADTVDDLNYTRILSFLFSAVTESTPLDFAFYARRINPMFDTQNAVEDGAPGLTCADTTSCHGVARAGLDPPNGANLGIVAGAGDSPRELRANFTEVSAFIDFVSPEQGALFLYPTNQIADPDNPGSTGVDHPGGADFAVDSRFARDIVTFSRGLRPDRDGFQPSWLVAGDYQGASDIDSETPIDEDAVMPVLFDPSGGGELAGEWDALFAGAAEVDVGAFLGGTPGGGRVAYAVAYLVNTTTTTRSVDVELGSINQARLRVGEAIQDIAPGGTARSRVDVPPSRASDAPVGTRVLIKLFEDEARGGMRFTLRLLRAGGDRPYTDAGGELLIKLSPRGGI